MWHAAPKMICSHSNVNVPWPRQHSSQKHIETRNPQKSVRNRLRSTLDPRSNTFQHVPTRSNTFHLSLFSPSEIFHLSVSVRFREVGVDAPWAVAPPMPRSTWSQDLLPPAQSQRLDDFRVVNNWWSWDDWTWQLHVIQMFQETQETDQETSVEKARAVAWARQQLRKQLRKQLRLQSFSS